MNSYSSAISFLRQQVSAYSQCAEEEFWKPRHEEAMACRELEALLELGLGLYRSIRKFTNAKEIDSEIRDLVAWWVGPCERVDEEIRHFEALGYTVEGATEFRKDWEEARKLSRLVPNTWRGQKIYTEAELKNIEFPYPPEPE